MAVGQFKHTFSSNSPKEILNFSLLINKLHLGESKRAQRLNVNGLLGGTLLLYRSASTAVHFVPQVDASAYKNVTSVS